MKDRAMQRFMFDSSSSIKMHRTMRFTFHQGYWQVRESRQCRGVTLCRSGREQSERIHSDLICHGEQDNDRTQIIKSQRRSLTCVLTCPRQLGTLTTRQIPALALSALISARARHFLDQSRQTDLQHYRARQNYKNLYV